MMTVCPHHKDLILEETVQSGGSSPEPRKQPPKTASVTAASLLKPPGSSAFSGHDSLRPKNNYTDRRNGPKKALSYLLIAYGQNAGNLTPGQPFIESPSSPALATSLSNASPRCSAFLSASARPFLFPSPSQLCSAASGHVTVPRGGAVQAKT
ncbi:unnamed protein product [Rangifer tarandus platyrhynchus]